MQKSRIVTALVLKLTGAQWDAFAPSTSHLMLSILSAVERSAFAQYRHVLEYSNL